VALIKIKTKQIKIVFICNQNAPIKGISKIGNHPPKNKIEYNVDINRIFPYSPKKKKAKIIEEYSKLYPATISASASGKSKGALLVSATIEIKKIIAIGNSGKINHPLIS